MNWKPAIAAAVLLAAGAAAQSATAGVVLYDDFDSQTPDQLNWTGDGIFSPSSPPGSVDLIGAGGSYDFFPGNGGYLDLDGSSGTGNNPAGQITSVMSFGPGSYTLTFLLGGNQRNAPSQTTQFSLGAWTDSLTLSATDGLGLRSYSFYTATGGNLIFTELGPSNQQGNILDKVTLTAVPEPSTWAMMIVGFGAVGTMVRGARRRQQLV